MKNTGYLIEVFIDDNPYSPTYQQTSTARTANQVKCPVPFERLVLVSEACESTPSGFTGNKIYTYWDQLKHIYISKIVPDETCRLSSTNELWMPTGHEHCETDNNGAYTGFALQEQKQKNVALANYGQLRMHRYYNPDCDSASTANYVELARSCNVIESGGSVYTDGSANVSYMDMNEHSATYGNVIVKNIKDSGCTNTANYTYFWANIGEMCGYDDQLIASGLTQEPPTTKFTVARRFKQKMPATPLNTDEYQFTVNTENDPSCSKGKYVEEYFDSDATICDGTTLRKVKIKYESFDGGVTYKVSYPIETSASTIVETNSPKCGAPIYKWENSMSTVCIRNNKIMFMQIALDQGILTRPFDESEEWLVPSMLSGDTKDIARVILGEECGNIGNSAFTGCISLEEVRMNNSLISIGHHAFSGCTSLETVIIPSGVTNIGNTPFIASGVKEIHFLGTRPPFLANDELIDDMKDVTIYVPQTALNAYKLAWPQLSLYIERERLIVKKPYQSHKVHVQNKYQSVDMGQTWTITSVKRFGQIIEEYYNYTCSPSGE